MVRQVEACRTLEEGTPVAVLKYVISADGTEPIDVSISHLDPEMYGDPDIIGDELHINSLVTSNGQYQSVDPRYRSDSGGGVQQRFDSAQLFTIPFDSSSDVSLTWRLLGEELVVDGETSLCEGGGLLECEEFPEANITELQDLVRETVSKYTGLLWKVMRRNPYTGSKKFLKKISKFYRRALSVVTPMGSTYMCASPENLGERCEQIQVDKKRYFELLDDLFNACPRHGTKLCERMRKEYRRKYRSLLTEKFPPNLWRCDFS